MDSVKVSVIMPCYNIEGYVSECLDSVLSQSLEDIEVLCFDDGSTDGTLAALEACQARDSRVIVVKQGNSGPSVARNKGLAMARGEYVSFVDSDDYLAPGALSKSYGLAREYDADVVHFNADIVFESKELEEQFQASGRRHTFTRAGYEKYNDKKKPADGPALFVAMYENGDFLVPIWLCLYRKAFIDRHRFRFIEGIFHADDVFTFETSLSAKSAVFLGESLYCYRIRPDSIMTAPRGRWNAASRIVGQKHMQDFLESIAPGMPRHALRVAKQYMNYRRQVIIDNFLKYLSDDGTDAEYLEVFASLEAYGDAILPLPPPPLPVRALNKIKRAAKRAVNHPPRA